jgi:hypothetical protein
MIPTVPNPETLTSGADATKFDTIDTNSGRMSTNFFIIGAALNTLKE